MRLVERQVKEERTVKCLVGPVKVVVLAMWVQQTAALPTWVRAGWGFVSGGQSGGD
jgi:hypothetical protein